MQVDDAALEHGVVAKTARHVSADAGQDDDRDEEWHARRRPTALAGLPSIFTSVPFTRWARIEHVP